MSNELPGDATARDEVSITITLKRRSAIAAKRYARQQGVELDQFFEGLLAPLIDAEKAELRRQMNDEEVLLEAHDALSAAGLEVELEQLLPPTEN